MSEQSKERIDFISVMTHELKTSLTAIIASAELLAGELQPDDQSPPGKLIQSIVRNAHRMDERLSLLSQMDKIRGEDFCCQPEPVEIGQVINSIAAQLYSITQSKRQSLTVELAGSPPLVKADRRCLEQILQNLLTNASKSTPEGGQIKVTAWQDNDSLVVQVSDTGIGIPAEEQEQIFQPYYQVNHNRNGKPSGRGLGLAITKFLVELQGGKLWLQSTVGQGSSFFFSLPLAER